MAQQGGARPVRTKTEAKPVSGPGKLSQRTDMTPADQVPSDPNVYGDRAKMQGEISGMVQAQPAQMSTPAPKVTGLFDPTERPSEPVTYGNPLGEGPGPESLQLPQRSFNVTSVLSRLAQNDPSGQIELILNELNSRGVQ